MRFVKRFQSERPVSRAPSNPQKACFGFGLGIDAQDMGIDEFQGVGRDRFRADIERTGQTRRLHPRLDDLFENAEQRILCADR